MSDDDAPDDALDAPAMPEAPAGSDDAFMLSLAESVEQDIMMMLGPMFDFAHVDLKALSLELAQEQLLIMQGIVPRLVQAQDGETFALDVSNGKQGVIQPVPGRPATEDAKGVVSFALLFAFMTMPTARAYVRLLGYTYRFGDAKPPAPKPRIILSS